LTEQRAASFRDVVGVGEFRALWLAHAESRLGDQLARVAIAVLVFRQTSSPLLTALTYALTFLPPLVSAPLLVGLADRLPRRTVLVVTDLCRAALVGVMAIPTVPLAGIAPLLIAMVSLQPLYSAARNAMLPRVLEGDRYPVGLGLADVTDSIAQVSGFAFGGIVVVLIGSRAALGIDALTFVLSVLLVRFGTRPHRPQPPADEAVGPDPAAQHGSRRSVLSGASLIWGDARLRTLALLFWLYGFYVVPEGVAAPYAHQLGRGAAAAGLLMAADPIGQGIGAILVTRVRPSSRPRLIGPLAVLTAVPLMLSAVHPTVLSCMVLWALTGSLSSFVILVLAEFTRAIPDHRRGQAVGLAGAGLEAAQGLGILLGGGLASLLTPSVSVALRNHRCKRDLGAPAASAGMTQRRSAVRAC
jgi:predicted MFS family arabinose efflux permease